MAKSGKFVPKNPEKYLGNVDKITFRSSWEARFFNDCDKNIRILKWCSEEIAIPYHKPTDVGPNRNKIRRYYPDVYLEVINTNNEIVRYLIEIKPLKETGALFNKKGKRIKHSLYDQVNIQINRAKWMAAKQLCDKNGIIFQVLTEEQLFRT